MRKFFPFFLSKVLQKEPKTAWKGFASAEATKGAALGARRLLKKAGENFRELGRPNLQQSSHLRHQQVNDDQEVDKQRQRVYNRRNKG